MGYNVECHCVKSDFMLKGETLPIQFKGGAYDAQNLSAEKASEKKGAWLQKENENCWRQKRTQEKTRKGQKKIDLLRFDFLSDRRQAPNIKTPTAMVHIRIPLSAFLFARGIPFPSLFFIFFYPCPIRGSDIGNFSTEAMPHKRNQWVWSTQR